MWCLKYQLRCRRMTFLLLCDLLSWVKSSTFPLNIHVQYIDLTLFLVDSKFHQHPVCFLRVSGGDRVSDGAGEETEAGWRGSAGPGERPELNRANQRERREDEGGCDSSEEWVHSRIPFSICMWQTRYELQDCMLKSYTDPNAHSGDVKCIMWPDLTLTPVWLPSSGYSLYYILIVWFHQQKQYQ